MDIYSIGLNLSVDQPSVHCEHRAQTDSFPQKRALLQSVSCEIQQFHCAPKCACIFLAIRLYYVNYKSVMKIVFYGLITRLARGASNNVIPEEQKATKPLTQQRFSITYHYVLA